MFYYLSFLRPPPLQVSSTDPVLITPQICNDLRTEYFDSPIDIYYAWSLCTPHPASPKVTTPAKLTSWRATTAYKEISVPKPPLLDAHTSTDPDGPSWRLILTCGTTPSDRTVVLGDTDTTGNTPFAVTSIPVRFPSRRLGGNKGAKQEQITRSYAVLDRPIVFDITEQTSFDLDKKIWDSGVGLSSWLVQLFARNTIESHEPLLSDLRASLFSIDARHILELGAGTGVVAITLAVLRSVQEHVLEGHQHQQHLSRTGYGSIVTTDLPSAMPILRHNIASNRALMSGGCVPEAVVLDWDHEGLAPPVQAQLEAGLDVIVMADVTYNTASFSALITTLGRLRQRCKRNGRSPRVLMGYKERHPDERSLWDRTREIGLCFQRIAQVSGAGGDPVEIWLG